MIAILAALLAGSHLIRPCATLPGGEPLPVACAPRPVTVEEATPFLGRWTSTIDGPSGPIIFTIAVDRDSSKVIARVSSDLMGDARVDDIIRTERGIALRCTMDMWGYSVPIVLTLTALGETLQTDVLLMQGQFVLGGVATRQPPQ